MDTVVLPNTLQYIGAYAFSDWHFNQLRLPDPVKKEGYVFEHWKNKRDSVVLSIQEPG